VHHPASAAVSAARGAAPIVEANKDRDVLLNFKKQDYWHFNDCDFTGSAANIEKTYTDVVNDLDPKRSDASAHAAELYGNLLHTVQAFYAHTNWLELLQPADAYGCAMQGDHQPRLVDVGYGAWPGMAPWAPTAGVVFVQGDPPPGESVTWCAGTRRVWRQ
jgi:hypothetical protein